jgi:hypothetical protein
MNYKPHPRLAAPSSLPFSLSSSAALFFTARYALFPLTAPRNPFLFNRFRTLHSRRCSTGPSNSFGIKRFRTLSRHHGGIPSSLYFPRLPLLQSPLFHVVHPISLQPLTKCSSRNSFALTTIHFHGGVYTPSILFSTLPPRASARIAHFCAPTPLFVTLAQKQGGGGRGRGPSAISGADKVLRPGLCEIDCSAGWLCYAKVLQFGAAMKN